jgi:hypothetical protein
VTELGQANTRSPKTLPVGHGVFAKSHRFCQIFAL